MGWKNFILSITWWAEAASHQVTPLYEMAVYFANGVRHSSSAYAARQGLTNGVRTSPSGFLDDWRATYLYNDTQRTQCSPCLIVFSDTALYYPRSLIRIMKHAAFTCSDMFRIFLKSILSLLLSCHSQISLLRSLNLGHARRIRPLTGCLFRIGMWYRWFRYISLKEKLS